MDKEYRINVILDLDNTIINALAHSDRDKLPSEVSDKSNGQANKNAAKKHHQYSDLDARPLKTKYFL